MQRTELIYLADPVAWRARATIIATADRDEGFGIILDRTVAYPQGGGQPSDVGRICGQAEAAFRFSKVTRGPDGEAIHLGHVHAGIFRVGDLVDVTIDWKVRDLHRRLHTGGELICAAVDRLGYRWKVTAASHFPGQSHVSFQCDIAASDVERFRHKLAEGLTSLIREETPIGTLYAESTEQVAKLCPTEAGKLFLDWPVRMVSAAPGFWRPCLGAHCSHTGEVGPIRLTKVRLRNDDLSVGYAVDSLSEHGAELHHCSRGPDRTTTSQSKLSKCVAGAGGLR
jgi:Ser-tRNA(Ala) deacylase AlaX